MSDDSRWHWARSRGVTEWEPACVDYRDGKPSEVWFAGMATSFLASSCDIADEIPPLARKDI